MRFKWQKNERDTILSDPIINNQDDASSSLKNVILDEDDDVLDESSSLNFISPDYKTANYSKWNIYKGILFSSLSTIFFSMCSVIVKYMKHIHPGQLAFLRFFGIFILSAPLVRFYREDYFGPSDLRHLLILRGLAGSTSLFLRFCALQHLPFVEASIIIFSAPVIVTIFACGFLNEPCGLYQSAAVILNIIGLCFTIKLPFLLEEGDFIGETWGAKTLNNTTSILDNNYHLTNSSYSAKPEITKSIYFQGVIEAVSSTFFAASVYIILRKARNVHYSVIMFNFGWVAIIETGLLTIIFGNISMPASAKDWLLIFSLIFLSFFGQILLTKSLQIEQAAPVAIIRSATDIILSFFWQIWLFDSIPDVWSISGAFLVSSSIFLISLRKWVLSLPPHSSLRHKFSLIR